MVEWTVKRIEEARRQRESTATENDSEAAGARASRDQLAATNRQALSDAQETRDRTVARLDEELADAKAEHETALKKIGEELESVCGLATVPWGSKKWSPFRSAPPGPPPAAVRIGSYRFPEISAPMGAPALVNPLCGRNVLIEADGRGRGAAVEALKSMVFRLFATMPPGSLEAVFVDPVDQGENITPFLEMKEQVGGKAVTEPEEIKDRVTKINQRVADVIQTYLKNTYQTLREYNANPRADQQPYILLVVFDFPAGFAECAPLLERIARNGPKCGITILATVDTEAKMPDGFQFGKLEDVSMVFTQEEERFVPRDDPFSGAPFAFDMLPPPGLQDDITGAVALAANQGPPKVLFEQVETKEEDWWKGSTAERVSVPIGMSGDELRPFELGEAAHHCLLCGTTGTGKSNLLHVLITNLALAYPPSELELYLVDFKEGVEFERYSDMRLPHAKVIGLKTDREFGLSVLRRLTKMVSDRGEKFNKAGCSDIQEYRRKGNPLPRVLLLVEEFQEFFSPDDPMAEEAIRLIEQLARQGRSFGIHVILSSQTVTGAARLLRGASMAQMGLRVALRCNEEDSELVLAEGNVAATTLGPRGDGIYNDNLGVVSANKRFQTAYLSKETGEKVLKSVAALQEEKEVRQEPMFVFNGNAEASPDTKSLFMKKLASPDWSLKAKATTWLGEPLDIQDEPTTAALFPQSGRNILVVGRNQKSGVTVLAMALASLALQYPPGGMKVYVIDMGFTADGGPTPLQAVASAIPHKVEVVTKEQDLVRVVAEVKAALESGPAVPTFLFVPGIQWARRLASDWVAPPMEPLADGPTTAEAFAEILNRGPERRVHVIAWCNTVASFERALMMSKGDFGVRVAFRLSETESSTLIDGTGAAKLADYRAILWDVAQPGDSVKFRPYAATDSFPAFVGDLNAAMKRMVEKVG